MGVWHARCGGSVFGGEKQHLGKNRILKSFSFALVCEAGTVILTTETMKS